MTAFRNDHSAVDFGVHGDRKASEGKASDSPLFVGVRKSMLMCDLFLYQGFVPRLAFNQGGLSLP